jgi:hypothetical protein
MLRTFMKKKMLLISKELDIMASKVSDTSLYNDFNTQSDEFLQSVETLLPNETALKQYRFMFNQVKLFDPKKPVYLFMDSLGPYGQNIMSKDDSFFGLNKDPDHIGNTLGINKYWSTFNTDVKDAIWAYLQILFILGMKILGRLEELQKLLI